MPVARRVMTMTQTYQVRPLFVRAASLGIGVLLAVLASGCVHLEQRVEIESDGTARVFYHYSVAEDAFETLQTAQRVVEHWQGRPPPASDGQLNWFFSRDQAASHFSGNGLRLASFRDYTKVGRKHVELSVVAEDIFKALSSGKFGLFSLSRTEDGNWRLLADLATDPGPHELTEEQLTHLRALCDDLWLCLEVTAPTHILESTASEVRGSRAKWVFDPGNDESFLKQTPRIELVFSGKRLDWEEGR